MSENPYEPPLQDLEQSQRRPIPIRRTFVLGTAMVLTPGGAVATYVAGVVLLSGIDPKQTTGLLSLLAGLFVLATPVLPAFLMVRVVARWLSTPDWWDTSVLTLSVVYALALLAVYFGR